MTPWFLLTAHRAVHQGLENELLYDNSTCWGQNIIPSQIGEHGETAETNLQMFCM